MASSVIMWLEIEKEQNQEKGTHEEGREREPKREKLENNDPLECVRQYQ